MLYITHDNENVTGIYSSPQAFATIEIESLPSEDISILKVFDGVVVIDNAKAVQAHNNKAAKSRAHAYKNEADSLFFKAQRQEIDIQEWINKVQEIKERFPYMEE